MSAFEINPFADRRETGISLDTAFAHMAVGVAVVDMAGHFVHLVNADHAIEERGVITIRTGQQSGEVWVEVADTGKGIVPEHFQKIFDPLFTTKPIGKGTGLSLSYGIVQKHHGRIEVESEVGISTTFRVWLPVKQPEDGNTTAGRNSAA